MVVCSLESPETFALENPLHSLMLQGVLFLMPVVRQTVIENRYVEPNYAEIQRIQHWIGMKIDGLQKLG
jgi:hypothetical protein